MELKNKKVLVAGSGKSGIGAANLLKKVGAVVTIYDGNVKLNKEDILAKLDNKENVDVILGELKEDVIKQFDLMILSPGIAIDAPFVNDVRDNNVPIWGEVELAYVVGKGRLAAITGTNGKTTTKELIAAVLKQKFTVHYTQGNLNNHIGVPLTLLQLTEKDDIAVVEMGANHPGEIRTLVHIAEPDYGIITNVGKAHLEGFGSFEGVIRTKGELYDFLREKGGATVFVQHENPYLNKLTEGLQCVYYGQEPGLYVSGEVSGCSPFLAFRCTTDGQTHEVQTHLIGTYNLDNALAAIAIGRYFGVDAESACRAIEEYVPQNDRSQLVETSANKLIVDAYNANPTSMMAALENFRRMEVPHKMVVLGDMKELGEGSHEEHQKIADYLMQCGIERIILVGNEFANTRHEGCCYASVDEVIAAFSQNKPEGYYILIKGSNSMKLSRLPEYL